MALVANRLRELLEIIKMSLRDIASEIDISYVTLSRMQNERVNTANIAIGQFAMLVEFANSKGVRAIETLPTGEEIYRNVRLDDLLVFEGDEATRRNPVRFLRGGF